MGRNQSLDVLRCIAILLVIGRHYCYPGLLYKAGWSGVDLFFVLSGFLISGLLFGEYQSRGAIDVKRFWIRRAFKIYPSFYGLMIYVIIVYGLSGETHLASWSGRSTAAHLRIDSLFAGVTLGYFQHFREEEFVRAGKFPLWLPAIALLAPLAFWEADAPWMDTIGLGMLSIGFGLFVLWAVNRTMPEWKLLKAMAWIGRYSYSIYLWHLIVKAYVGYYESGQRLITLPLYVIACLGIGRLAAYLVETPFLQLRDKLYPAQKAEARLE